MAAKTTKRGATKGETPDDDAESTATTTLEGIEDDAQESMALDLQAALAEVGGDSGQVSVQFIKISPKDEAGACTTYTSAELSIDRVRDEWGAGTYKLYFRGADGRIVTRKMLSIVPKKAQPQVASASDIAKLLEKQHSGDANNTTVLLMKMLEMQGNQMVAILSRPQPQQQLPPPMGPAEMIAMMTGLAQIMKPATQPDSPMDAMLKGVKLANELRGDGDDNGIVGMISKGLDVIPGLMQGGGAVPATPAPPAARSVEVRQIPTPPTTVATPEVVPTYTGKDAKENDMLAKLVWLRGRIAYLLEKARMGRDPELYADLFLDELPTFVSLEDIREQLGKADWFGQLCSINRECELHVEWFADFRATTIEAFREADEAASIAAPQPDSDSTSTDGETTPLK